MRTPQVHVVSIGLAPAQRKLLRRLKCPGRVQSTPCLVQWLVDLALLNPSRTGRALRQWAGEQRAVGYTPDDLGDLMQTQLALVAEGGAK